MFRKFQIAMALALLTAIAVPTFSSVASAGAAPTLLNPKFAARIVKSAELMVPSPLKSPSIHVPEVPKWVASELKSSALTR